jgi:hypothetical protein|tara:strand:- start:123 stop:488 length:366 start_codon:yes stop_codon:yes gene_type:complete
MPLTFPWRPYTPAERIHRTIQRYEKSRAKSIRAEAIDYHRKKHAEADRKFDRDAFLFALAVEAVLFGIACLVGSYFYEPKVSRSTPPPAIERSVPSGDYQAPRVQLERLQPYDNLDARTSE